MYRLTITKERPLAATPLRVFDALTTPEEIVRCFPYTAVEIVPGVGGSFTAHGDMTGTPFTDYGEITAWSPGEEFAYTYWSTNHGTLRTPENHLEIRYRLTSTEGGTLLRLDHGNVPAGPYHEIMIEAWDGLLTALATYVVVSSPL